MLARAQRRDTDLEIDEAEREVVRPVGSNRRPAFCRTPAVVTVDDGIVIAQLVAGVKMPLFHQFIMATWRTADGMRKSPPEGGRLLKWRGHNGGGGPICALTATFDL